MTGLRVPQGGGFRQMAVQAGTQGLQAYTAQRPGQKTEVEAPPLTIGGGLSAAAGMGIAGYTAAGAVKGGISGPMGGLIGAGIGALAYFLS